MNTVEDHSLSVESVPAQTDSSNASTQLDEINSNGQEVSSVPATDVIALEDDAISVPDTEELMLSPTSTAQDMEEDPEHGEEGYLVCVSCWDEMVAVAQAGAAMTQWPLSPLLGQWLTMERTAVSATQPGLAGSSVSPWPSHACFPGQSSMLSFTSTCSTSFKTAREIVSSHLTVFRD